MWKHEDKARSWSSELSCSWSWDVEVAALDTEYMCHLAETAHEPSAIYKALDYKYRCTSATAYNESALVVTLLDTRPCLNPSFTL